MTSLPTNPSEFAEDSNQVVETPTPLDTSSTPSSAHRSPSEARLPGSSLGQHLWAGFVWGLWLLNVHLFVVGIGLQGRPTAGTFRLTALGHLWILAGMVLGAYLARTRPLTLDEGWTPIKFAFFFVVGILGWGFLHIAIMFSGYC